RTVEEPRRLLKYRQADAAVQILGEIARAPVVGETNSNRPLLVKAHDVEGVIGHTLQAMRVDDHTGHHGDTGAHRTDTAARGRIDQIRVVYSGLIDVGVIGLQTQAAQQSRLEVEKGLVAELEPLELAPVLHIDRTLDLRGLRGAIVGE